MKKNVWFILGMFFATVGAASLVGCSSSSGGGGTPITASYNRGVISAATGSTITVNGYSYDAGSADIKINGATGSVSDLKIGREVEIKGSADDSNKTGHSSEIRYSDDLTGPISAMSGTTVPPATVTVLGQTIKIDANTKFEAPLTGLASLGTGSVIEVSGLPDTTGAILATYIEAKTGASEYEIKGVVGAFNTTTFTLTPNNTGTALTVTLGAGVSVPSGFANGSLVEVTIDPATYTLGSMSITAKGVDIETELEPTENDSVELDGFVMNLSGTTFSLDGVTVNAAAVSLTGVVNGTRVEVHGTLTGGVLVANSLTIESSSLSPSFFKGAITALGSIFVNGIEFDIDNSSILVNGSTGTAGDLKVGMQVEIKGNADDTFKTGKATEVRFSDELTGPISSITGTGFVVLGQTVVVDGNTKFEPPLAGLVSLGTGSVVEVSGSPTATGAIAATYIEAKTGASEYEIKGIVSAYAGGTTFTLTPNTNGTALSVTLGTGVTVPNGFADGVLVEVKIDAATGVTGPTSVTASEVDLENELSPSEHDSMDIEGIVASVDSGANTFVINGITVNAGTLALPSVGALVEVHGTYSGGVFTASSIEVK